MPVDPGGGGGGSLEKGVVRQAESGMVPLDQWGVVGSNLKGNKKPGGAGASSVFGRAIGTALERQPTVVGGEPTAVVEYSTAVGGGRCFTEKKKGKHLSTKNALLTSEWSLHKGKRLGGVGVPKWNKLGNRSAGNQKRGGAIRA